MIDKIVHTEFDKYVNKLNDLRMFNYLERLGKNTRMYSTSHNMVELVASVNVKNQTVTINLKLDNVDQTIAVLDLNIILGLIKRNTNDFLDYGPVIEYTIGPVDTHLLDRDLNMVTETRTSLTFKNKSENMVNKLFGLIGQEFLEFFNSNFYQHNLKINTINFKLLSW